MMKKAIGYIRVSTQSQASEGVSLEAQEAKIKAWCELNSYELVQIFKDAGISGSSLKGREGLADAIEATKKGFALVAYSMSRLSRSIRDMLDIGDQLNRNDSDMVSLTEKIDTTTATGKMVFNMMAVMNQFERDQCSERTKIALQHKKSKGERVGSIPHGYKAKGKKLIKNKDEQKILTLVKQLREQGYTLRAISNELELKGIFNREGRKFAPQSINSILNYKLA